MNLSSLRRDHIGKLSVMQNKQHIERQRYTCIFPLITSDVVTVIFVLPDACHHVGFP